MLTQKDVNEELLGHGKQAEVSTESFAKKPESITPEEAKFEGWVGTINRTPSYYTTVNDLILNGVPEEMWERLADRCEPVRRALGERKGLLEKERSVSADLSKSESGAMLELESECAENLSDIFSTEGQVNYFFSKQPFFYDKNNIFHLWNLEEKKWEISDIEDMLNGLRKEIPGADTINSRKKSEISNALKQIGRDKKPKNLPVSCIQFRDRIVCVKSGREFPATAEYYATNPIPWKLGDSYETPVIDSLLKEWVVDGSSQCESYVKTMKQVLAHISCSDQFMQRIVALCGGGMNGKGSFIKLVEKFIGEDNYCSTDLRILANVRFETSALYKKLACIMGEVNSDDLTNTNTLKKLCGEDKMRYEFKGKGSFTEESPTTCIIATNNLPSSPDKSKGFFRRWLIVDFPHEFSIREGLIEKIPEVEFENLGRCVLELLKEMYRTNKFENEGSIDSRAEKYEERSNPILKFIETECDTETYEKTKLQDFCRAFNDYLKSKHLPFKSPISIGKLLRVEGFEVSPRTLMQGSVMVSAKCVLNLKFNTTKTTKTT